MKEGVLIGTINIKELEERQYSFRHNRIKLPIYSSSMLVRPTIFSWNKYASAECSLFSAIIFSGIFQHTNSEIDYDKYWNFVFNFKNRHSYKQKLLPERSDMITPGFTEKNDNVQHLFNSHSAGVSQLASFDTDSSIKPNQFDLIVKTLMNFRPNTYQLSQVAEFYNAFYSSSKCPEADALVIRSCREELSENSREFVLKKAMSELGHEVNSHSFFRDGLSGIRNIIFEYAMKDSKNKNVTTIDDTILEKNNDKNTPRFF